MIFAVIAGSIGSVIMDTPSRGMRLFACEVGERSSISFNRFLCHKLFKDDRGIIAAESECVQEGVTNLSFLDGLSDTIQTAGWVWILVVGCGMNLSGMD